MLPDPAHEHQRLVLRKKGRRPCVVALHRKLEAVLAAIPEFIPLIANEDDPLVAEYTVFDGGEIHVREAAGNRTLVTRLKAKCSTIELRPQNRGRRSVFDWSLRGSARDRTEIGASTRDLQSRPEPRRSALPNAKSPPKGFPRGGSRALRLFSLGLCVWSLPFVGRGLRLALGTHDDPLSVEVRLAFPEGPCAYGTHGALAPGGSRMCGCDQHGLALRKEY